MYSTSKKWVKIGALIMVAPYLPAALTVQANNDLFSPIQAQASKLPTNLANGSLAWQHAGLSVSAQALVQWVMQTNDHQGKPFAVVDKIHAKVFVLSHHGRLLGQAPVLLGLTRGDDGVLGSGDLPLSQIRPEDRITPAGRFVSEWGRNASGQMVLWVDYEQAISMHAVRSLSSQERRLERLASPIALDKRISYGCINVSLLFWRSVVLPVFMGIQGIVYVMPDSRTLVSVFPGLAIEHETAAAN
jgi:hypothetical protein